MTDNSSKDSFDGFIVPNPSKFSEDLPGDAGDEANEIRFSEEEALIEEQAHGIRPDTYSVPGMPNMSEALGNIDLPLEDTGATTESDASDDSLHGGAEQ
ncbi:MAG: hypothetical protein JWO49_1742 [Arthrobacter sp.]|nr:hypothetical protein [Arthrobacter sp.]